MPVNSLYIFRPKKNLPDKGSGRFNYGETINFLISSLERGWVESLVDGKF